MNKVLPFLLLFCGLPVAAAELDQLSKQCLQSLSGSTKAITTLPGCDTLFARANKGEPDAYYRLGQVLVNGDYSGDQRKRIKKGLFYLLMAADSNHRQAIAALSEYVKGKMIDGKIPLDLSHYESYVKMDWKLSGAKNTHHYVLYTRWLENVELSQTEPQKLSPQIQTQMAIDYENGYFLGRNPQRAEQLYKLAADQGNAFAQFKVAERLYPKAQAQALKLLHLAAEGRSADAMMALGDHYGCNGDSKKALSWYQQALEMGSEYAEEEIAAIKQSGKPSLCR